MVKQVKLHPVLLFSHLQAPARKATVPTESQREAICEFKKKTDTDNTSFSTNTESLHLVCACDKGCPSKPQHSTPFHPINREHHLQSHFPAPRCLSITVQFTL